MATFHLYSRICTSSKKDLISLYDVDCDGVAIAVGYRNIPDTLERVLPMMFEQDILVSETGLRMSKEMVRLAVEENRIEALMKM